MRADTPHAHQPLDQDVIRRELGVIAMQTNGGLRPTMLSVSSDFDVPVIVSCSLPSGEVVHAEGHTINEAVNRAFLGMWRA